MRPPIRRTRRTQQALVGLSVVGALGAATTLDLTTQHSTSGTGAVSSPTRANARANARAHAHPAASRSDERGDDDAAPATSAPVQHRARSTTVQPAPAPQPAPQPQATTSGS